MNIKPVWMQRDQMVRYIVRYAAMKGSDKGLPDSELPGNYKILYNVMGFRAIGNSPTAVSPVGNDLSPAIDIDAGFSLGYTKCPPGNGPLMHVHDTVETFIVLTGTWRFLWEPVEGQTDHFDLTPLDVFAVPPGVPRRFYNLTPGEGADYGMLMAVTGGVAPVAEFSEEIEQYLAQHKQQAAQKSA